MTAMITLAENLTTNAAATATGLHDKKQQKPPGPGLGFGTACGRLQKYKGRVSEVKRLRCKCNYKKRIPSQILKIALTIEHQMPGVPSMPLQTQALPPKHEAATQEGVELASWKDYRNLFFPAAISVCAVVHIRIVQLFAHTGSLIICKPDHLSLKSTH